MVYVRALARAAAQIVLFCLGLWGLQVTFDLTALILVAAGVGTLNFVIAVHDERQKEAAKAQSIEDRETLRELQRFVVKVAGAANIPPHLQNLSVLSNADLKALIHSTTDRLRQFAHESGEGNYGPPIWERVPGYDSLTEEQRIATWEAESRRESDMRGQKTERFIQGYRPDALALWEELERRVEIASKGDAGRAAVLLQHGSLAGPRPIETIATEIESAARRLPDT